MSDDAGIDKEKDEEDVLDSLELFPRRRRYIQEGQGTSTWLISFTDVMALMLTFFVLLFAMSHPKKEQWEEFTNTVQKNFNNYQGKPLNRATQDTINIEKVNFSKALNLSYLRSIIENLIDQESSLRNVELIELDDRLIISLPQDMLFESGSADVKSSANQALFELAGTLDRIKNPAEVVGHTDPRPVNGGQFSSNWELSFYRAANVATALESLGYKQGVVVRGMASSRYYDLDDSFTENEKYNLSRRVDIVMMRDSRKRLKVFDIGVP